MIEPLRSAAGMQELLRGSFVNRFVRAKDRGAMRFRVLAHVLARVPVRRLSYPDGADSLVNVVAAVESDRSGSWPRTAHPQKGFPR